MMHVDDLEAIQAHVKHVYTQVHRTENKSMSGGDWGYSKGILAPKYMR